MYHCPQNDMRETLKNTIDTMEAKCINLMFHRVCILFAFIPYTGTHTLLGNGSDINVQQQMYTSKHKSPYDGLKPSCIHIKNGQYNLDVTKRNNCMTNPPLIHQCHSLWNAEDSSSQSGRCVTIPYIVWIAMLKSGRVSAH